jgi:hypothetical protein
MESIMKLGVRSIGAHRWRRAQNLLAVAATLFATSALPAQVVFHVSLGQASTTPVSGRLLVFAKPLGPADKRPVTAVNMDRSVAQIRAARQMDIPAKLAIPMRVIASNVAIACQLDAYIPTKALATELIPGFADEAA